MIDNKYFNASSQTMGGKPKFMPPQKRFQQDDLPPQKEEFIQEKPKFEHKQNFEQPKQHYGFKPLFGR
jgi:hypothetical protein